ncbi:hypothetical protein CRV24_008785 [Beauveria bassiana]|nr:hypothetical protein CRV24_008785 [Beauveria bassiana]
MYTSPSNVLSSLTNAASFFRPRHVHAIACASFLLCSASPSSNPQLLSATESLYRQHSCVVPLQNMLIQCCNLKRLFQMPSIATVAVANHGQLLDPHIFAKEKSGAGTLLTMLGKEINSDLAPDVRLGVSTHEILETSHVLAKDGLRA